MKVGIFGASGFGREIADICIALGYEKIVFLDRAEILEKSSASLHNYEVFEEDICRKLSDEGYVFVIGIGDGVIRRRIYEKFPYLNYVNIVHPDSSFGSGQLEILSARKGNIVCAGSRFSNNIICGDFGVFNYNSTVGHDCIIGDYVTVLPGANVSGNVQLSDHCVVGSNATILPGDSIDAKMVIGSNATVAAGMLITKDVPPNVTAIYQPTKLIYLPKF